MKLKTGDMKTELFNEKGVPNDRVANLAHTMMLEARNFLLNLFDEGYSPVEIRAAGGFLTGSVELATSTVSIHMQFNSPRKNLTEEELKLDSVELEFIANEQRTQAVKHYRNRTGRTLREAIEAVGR